VNNFIVTPVVIGCNPDMGMFLQDSQKNNPVEGLSEINFRLKKALITSDTHQRTLYETGRTSTVKRESARKS
jgi:ribosomal protein S21